jgi:hypothetical protein
MDAEFLGADLFSDPVKSRAQIIDAVRHARRDIPDRGSSFFIHLSELCPVACEHCMYSSDLTRKTAKDSLSPAELDAAIDFINESRSEKLNITGGGEPFVKFPSILRLLERVDVPRVEIVSAGHWGRSQVRAKQLLERMGQAIRDNPHRPRVLLRLSADRYHIEAPQPVRIGYYGNIARAWRQVETGMDLGFRSIQPDIGSVDRALAGEIGAEIEPVDEWNSRLVFPDGVALPITFNVFRLSGKAAELRDDLLDGTLTIRDYYAPFETADNKLTLATTVNDAIRGSYGASRGAAVTMNSDGTFWIFAGTAPDRRQLFDGQGFAEAMSVFFDDPITHLLVDEGIWELAGLVASLDPATHDAALAKNDVASLVEDLLAPPDVRLAVTLLAAQRILRADGSGAGIDGDSPIAASLAAAVAAPDLLGSCARQISSSSGSRSSRSRSAL